MMTKEQLRIEINRILGFDAQDAVETMLENLEDGVLVVPYVSDEQKEQIREAKAKYQLDKGGNQD